MIEDRIAQSAYPIHELLRQRYSPYCFSDKPVPMVDLKSLFTAASWAASSFNEQPWRYIVATREQPQAFERVLSCLDEGNQNWAKHVPVLALGVMKATFTQNGKVNRVAFHDLGAASASLTFEATARGLAVHQMAGINPDKAREVFNIPEDFKAQTGVAIGYAVSADDCPDSELADRDRGKRERKRLEEFVFASEADWGTPFSF